MNCSRFQSIWRDKNAFVERKQGPGEISIGSELGAPTNTVPELLTRCPAMADSGETAPLKVADRTKDDAGIECFVCRDPDEAAPLLACGCSCKGASTMYGHIPCLVQNARTSWENDTMLFKSALSYNPWFQCPVCKELYGSQLISVLSREQYRIYGRVKDLDDANILRCTFAVRGMAIEHCRSGGDYAMALVSLQDIC